MIRFRIQLLIENNTWRFRYIIPEKGRYTNSPTQWTKLSLSFTGESYGVTLIYDETDSAPAGMCFKNIEKTQSVY